MEGREEDDPDDSTAPSGAISIVTTGNSQTIGPGLGRGRGLPSQMAQRNTDHQSHLIPTSISSPSTASLLLKKRPGLLGGATSTVDYLPPHLRVQHPPPPIRSSELATVATGTASTSTATLLGIPIHDAPSDVPQIQHNLAINVNYNLSGTETDAEDPTGTSTSDLSVSSSDSDFFRDQMHQASDLLSEQVDGSAGKMADPSVSTITNVDDGLSDAIGPGTGGEVKKEKRRRGKRVKSPKQTSDDAAQAVVDSQGEHTSNKMEGKQKKKKFNLAPQNFLDRILLWWGFRLVYFITRAEDMRRDVPLHLKSTESARATGEALEKEWNDEVRRWKESNACSGEINDIPVVGEVGTGPGGRASTLDSTAFFPTSLFSQPTTRKSGRRYKGDCKKGKFPESHCGPQLWRALNKAFGVRYSSLAVWKILWALFTYLGSFGILKWIVEFCDQRTSGNNSTPFYRGHLLALALFLSTVFSSFCFHQLSIQCTKSGVQCRAALMVLIYRKSMRLSYVRGGVSDIVNLIANECNRIAEATMTLHYLWSAVAECAIIIALACYDIGLAAVPAIVLIIGILFLQYHIACRASDISFRSTSLVTRRSHLMSEILTAIKLIKFYAWETYYVQKISRARRREMAELRAALITKAVSCMVVFISPAVVTLACLATFVLIRSTPPSAAGVFTLLSLFNTLRYPLVMLPTAVKTFRGAEESLHHLETFFNLPEVEPGSIQAPRTDDPDLIIDIKRANFIWDGDLDHPHITDLTLEIRRRQLIAVVGDLSSGKSLLAAIIGQIAQRGGTVATHGSCGYVPQEPWIINATIRDNILFGLDYDEQRYLDVIRVCGLTRDLMLLSNGDDSVTGDLNLSASQRQRLSLARCLYRNPDVVLLEDCLSDFDQAHAKRLFKECVRNVLLKNQAVVLVTQQKQFLPECDLILVLKNGHVVEQGTFAELKARKVTFSAWVSDYITIEDDPAGVLDEVNEIKLENFTQSTLTPGVALSPISPVSNPASRFLAQSSSTGGATSSFRSPFGQGRQLHQHKPSPLATADVITQDPIELATLSFGRDGNPQDANQLTIRALMALNQQSIQNSQLNERTISKMIERSQLSVLTGNATRPPVNFPNQDPVARTIEANTLTVHSAVGFDPQAAAAEFGDKGIVTRASVGPVAAYDLYLREGYGRLVGYSIVALFFFVHGVRFFSDVWLAFFVTHGGPSGYYLGVYGGLTCAIAIGVFLRGLLFTKSVLRKSTTLHDRCLERVIHAPMSFFDMTPLGQILSNFARHLFLVDETLPDAALQALSFAPIPLGTLILVSTLVPWFWTTLPVYFALAYVLVLRCGEAEKKLRALEASNKSPMFEHLSSTLEGLFSIRLYEAQSRFDAFNRVLIDADHKALYSLFLVRTLQALYIDLICSLAIYATAALCVAESSISAPIAGTAISNVLQLLLFVQWLVRVSGDVHVCMKGVAAVAQFTEHIPAEESNDVELLKVPGPDEWPTRGDVEFRQVTLRYHRYGVAVLKSVSFRLVGGEKIGIVGRSGSGKTTLLVALLRIVEHVEGDIFIDGVDIRRLSLADLRSRIAVIPQEPVLLTGTIRSNLDPSNLRSDEEVWKAVRDVHLGAKIEDLPLKLETPIHENGRTFTLAERQLFCVARAILMKTKIVVFDEPTIAADNDTDTLIQSTIHENFASATVIVLASRFRMIAQADRIIVMEHGKIVEFDSPLSLLDNPRSKFSLMVSQTGDVDLGKLRQLALARADEKAGRKSAGSLSSPTVSNRGGSSASVNKKASVGTLGTANSVTNGGATHISITNSSSPKIAAMSANPKFSPSFHLSPPMASLGSADSSSILTFDSTQSNAATGNLPPPILTSQDLSTIGPAPSNRGILPAAIITVPSSSISSNHSSVAASSSPTPSGTNGIWAASPTALSPTSMAHLATAASTVAGNSLGNGTRRAAAMPRSLEEIFGESAQMERERSAAAAYSSDKQ